MPYLWEQPNLGNNLYEMAFNKRKALLETEKNPAAETGTEDNPAAETGTEDNPAKNTAGSSEEDALNPRFELDVEGTKALDGKTDGETATVAAKKEETKEEKPKEELDALTKYAITVGFDKDLALQIKNTLDNVKKNGTFDGEHENKAAVKLASALKSGNPDVIKKVVEVTGKAIKDGKIQFDDKNPQLYAEQKEEKSVDAPIKMPAIFEAEPDDSMWNDMIVNDFGMPLINLSHPAVAKIIKSDNPEEECPGDLKVFKKAVYGDKRLTAVFGEGGISRVVLGKMANLLTLGIAGATVDAGKRADRIIKELHEKGGHIAHRNLLFIGAEELLDADADNDEQKIPAVAYSRSKKAVLGQIDVPATALAHFYSAVDPIQSAKIYLEILSVDDKLAQSLDEATDIDGNPILEGKGLFGRVAGAARAIQDKVTGDKATNPQTSDSDKVSDLKKKWVEYLQRHGQPPFYVLKPKTANKEVDVISTSATGHAGTSGGKVNMVTMNVGGHKCATFMSPKEIKLYFGT